MGKIVITTNVSLDGVVQDPDGEEGSVPRNRYSAPHGFRRLEFSLSAPPLAPVPRRHLHTFRTRASSGLMLPVRRTPPGQ
jgi:hypothetical protein